MRDALIGSLRCLARTAGNQVLVIVVGKAVFRGLRQAEAVAFDVGVCGSTYERSGQYVSRKGGLGRAKQKCIGRLVIGGFLLSFGVVRARCSVSINNALGKKVPDFLASLG